MNVRLERADIADAEQILAMQKICFAPHLERYQDFETNPAMASLDEIGRQIQHENFYKILYNGLWVGAINIQVLDDKGNCKLRIINILPEYQGLGIGQTAIALAEKIFADARTWRLETLADMPHNRHVYEKMGYVFTGKTEVVNDKLTLVHYRKEVVL